MPYLQRPDAKIYYELHGDPEGPTVLLIAPGGMNSVLSRWRTAPWDPIAGLSGHRVVAMDQRNAGASSGAVSADDGWRTYTADQLALVDHLGIDRFAVVGMCIGGPYVMGLCRAAPERVAAAVMLQPIGLSDNRQIFFDLFDRWAAGLQAAHPHMSEADWIAFRSAMFGGDFLFNATRAQAASCQTRALVLMGDDPYHPAHVSRELAALMPNAELIPRWKDTPAATDAAIRAFLPD